jgi:hypothetical protein
MNMRTASETSARPRAGRPGFLGKWRKPAIIAAAVLAVYAIIGFLVVPPIARSQIVKLASAKLHRQAAIRYVHFNPFTLTAVIGGFDLRDRDGTDLLKFDRLTVDLQLSGVFRRAWKFRLIGIERPQLVARIGSNGQLSVADLFPPPSAPPAPGPARTPRIIVGQFKMDYGRLDYVDESRTPRFAETLDPINLDVREFSTIPDVTGDHGLVFGIGPDTRIRWTGSQTIEPLRLEGRCEVTGLSLPLAWRYAAPAPGLELRDGRADISWTYDVRKEADGFSILIADAAVAARDIALRPAAGSEDWLTVPLAEVRGISVKWPGRTVDVDGIKITGPRVLAALETDGRTNWQTAVAGTTASSGAPAAAPAMSPDRAAALSHPPEPWAVKIGSFEIENGTAQIDDRHASPPVAVALSKFGLRLDNLSTDLKAPVALRASTRINETGELDVSGTVKPEPTAADLSVTVLELDLVPFRSYLSLFPGAELKAGKADLKGKIRVSQGKPSMRVEGEAAITGLDLSETGSGRLLGWNVAKATGIEVTRGPDRVRAARIDLDDPFFRIFISRDGKLNLSQLGGSAKTAPGAAPSPVMPVEAAMIALRNATLDYTDESLVLPFDTRIYSTNGALRDISTTSAASARLDLEGRVAQAGFFKATGALQISDPFTSTDVGVTFRQVPMADLTPYFAQFAGYSVKKGDLDVDIRYTIKDRHLVGQNKVVMAGLTLGPKVPGAKGPGLPVRLAIALLKDKDGRIDLNVPVQGTVDSPEFNYGKLFWQALKKILVGLVTAPFRAIGRLFGSNAEDLDLVGFSSGSSELLPAESETLSKIAAELANRPELAVEVGGRYDPQADVDALRRSRLEARIDAKRTGTATLETILESLYAESFSPEKLEAERAKFEPQAATLETGKKKGRKTKPTPPAAPSIAFNAGGFYDSLRTQLLDAEAVGTDELQALARARAAAIVGALTAPGRIDPSRVKAGEVKPVSRKKRGSDLVASEMTLSAGD